ncbi:acetyl-CoA decarbonylase/synthase complex subunit delta [Dissulfurirhabdus thermomarina]|uniref:acetyl-CoA decarbonylase/synthase complex subunit delta n=2 Tax=Dissulfurirhabdus thermomarina TaxID=1765737 RepID=UPI001470807B|nr:acetyl-CoA decarbonylase/synthase complex subunit delta [Dissulfurirhabdus thermomarina]
MIAGSNLEQVLASGQFAVTGELGPPKNGDPEVVRQKARILKGHVDAVNITDCQTAIVRMSSLTAGLIALSEGVEPVMQMTCRDRNRIGMQSDILGAAALGIRNLLCLTGDHQKFGNHPQAKGVFDMDSIQLLGMVRRMRDERRFQCGEEIKGGEPRLFLGAAANPFADPFEYRPIRLGKKVAAGADFIQTQIIYNVEKFARFMERVRDLGLHEKVYILAGVTPPKSVGMANYMKKFVPGLDVTDEVIQRMRAARDKQEEGIDICVDIIRQVREIPGVAGVHIMAIEWEQAVPEIVKRAGLDPRPAPKGVEAVLGGAAALEAAEKARQEAEAASVHVLREKDRLAAEVSGLRSELEAARGRAEKGEAEVRRLLAELEAAKAALAAGGAAPALAGAATMTPEGGESMAEKMDRERRALTSLSQGLQALRKVMGLSEEQFEALRRFIEAEFYLSTGIAAGTLPAAAAAPAGAPAPAPAPAAAERPEPAPAAAPAGLPPCPPEFTEDEWRRKWVIRLVAQGNVALHNGDAAAAEAAFRRALELDPADAKAKAGLARAEAGEVGPGPEAAPAAEVPKAPEAAPPKPEAPAAKEVEPAPAEPTPKPEPPKPAAEKPKPAPKKAPAAAPAPAGAAGLEVPPLASETASLEERAGAIPADGYKDPATGTIREVVLGEGDKAVAVGGVSTLPFHLFEGEMSRPPATALEVLDEAPEEWPESLARHYADVLSDPVAWARKCVQDYGARAVCLSLVSTDPNGTNRASAEAAQTAKAVVEALDVPVILWGCGNAEKDTETLREVTSLIGDRKVCLAPLTDANYRNIGATAMAFQLPVVASTPIDVNLAKQLNILLENLGLSLDHVLMDPSIGALGYGLEYTYSVMERIRLAALTQQDDKLQAPFICHLGREVWKAKETRLPSDEMLGDQERRGVLMEAMTAVCLMLAGGDLMVMRHPKAVALAEAVARGLM